MGKRPIFIELGDKAPGQEDVLLERGAHLPAEDELGSGDICSIEETPSTDDDKALD